MSLTKWLSVLIVRIVSEFDDFFGIASYPIIGPPAHFAVRRRSMSKSEELADEMNLAGCSGFAGNSDYRGKSQCEARGFRRDGKECGLFHR
jgi:hypothetical protein